MPVPNGKAIIMDTLDDIPAQGMLEPEHHGALSQWWLDAWQAVGRKVDGFEPVASLAVRLAWCVMHGIAVACGYGRFSTKMQSSDMDQARAMVVLAAGKGYYLPPEFISVDRARTGKSRRRQGLERNTAILGSGRVAAMVFYS